MRILVKAVVRGADVTADPGAVLEVADDLGRALVAAGAAEAVGPLAVEVATAPAPLETAEEHRPASFKPHPRRR